MLLCLFAAFFWRQGLRQANGTAWATAAWGLMTVSRVRNGEFFATAFALYASAQWLRHPFANHLAKRSDWFRPADDCYLLPTPMWRAYAAPAALAALAAALKVGGVSASFLGAGWVNLASDVAPVEALPTLRAYAADHRPGQAIFNDMNFGGFVIHFLPTLKVYIDDRCELLRDAGMREYFELMGDPRRIEALADRYGLELALVTTDSPTHPSPFDRYLSASPRWCRVHADRVATVYRRSSPAVGVGYSALPH